MEAVSSTIDSYVWNESEKGRRRMNRKGLERETYLFGDSFEISQCSPIHLLRLADRFLHSFNAHFLILKNAKMASTLFAIELGECLTCSSCSAYSLVSK